MRHLFLGNLKRIARHAPLLVLLIVAQILLGQISANALASREPEVRFALIPNGAGELAQSLVQSVTSVKSADVTVLAPGTSPASALRDSSLQAAVVVTEDFDERMHGGRGDAILIYPAPGVSDVSVITEFFAAELIRQKADALLDEALAETGLDKEEYLADYAEGDPIINIDYIGPAGGSIPFSAPPAYGVPALLLLLAFLHAAMLLPGPDQRRFRLASAGPRARSFFASLLTLYLAWILVTACYALAMRLFYHASVQPGALAVLFLIPLYAMSLSAILVALGGRRAAPWVFVFWLAANMTLGGGLWNAGVTFPLLRPLLPVLEAVNGDPAGYSAAAFLLAETVAAILVSAGITSTSKKTPVMA
ncbi:MAG: hypothetical protein LBR14_01255 [Clostridiales Family XIII bacterium]|jgi:hypothetical protein|nr:hypothetical protein [Clostridiales Family XIII bacterium]